MAEELHQYRMSAKVWLWSGGKASWHFITLPKKESDAIRMFYGNLTRGWGSLPVAVTIGKTRWTTSIFPERKSGSYILPLKAAVRDAEKIAVGKTVRFTLEVRA